MREAAMPRAFSRAMSSPTAACDSRMPRSSGMRAMSPWVMSYQARITKPLLIVTGRIGACGKTNRRARPSGSGSSRTIGTKSQPSAPRPCSQMTLPAGSLPVASSIDCSGSMRSAPRGTDRGLRAERLHHLRARLDVRAADEIDAVRDGGEDPGDDRLAVRGLEALERLADRFRLPGKIQDQRVAADHRDLAREDRRRHEFQADAAHLLAESGHLAIGHGERRLGRDVARRGARAAGRDDEMAAAIVGELLQRRLDHRALVGNEAALERERIQERAAQPLLERGNALVAIDALGSAIARRDEPDTHGVMDGRAHGCLRAWSWISAFSQWKSSRYWRGARPEPRSSCAAATSRRSACGSASGYSPRKASIAEESASISWRQRSAAWKSAAWRREGVASAESWAAMGPASTSRMMRPMYCIWRRIASCLVKRLHSRTASRSRSGSSRRASCSSESLTSAAPTSWRSRIWRLRRVLLIKSRSSTVVQRAAASSAARPEIFPSVADARPPDRRIAARA